MTHICNSILIYCKLLRVIKIHDLFIILVIASKWRMLTWSAKFQVKLCWDMLYLSTSEWVEGQIAQQFIWPNYVLQNAVT